MSCAIISCDNQGLNLFFIKRSLSSMQVLFSEESKNTLQVKDVSFKSDQLESIESVSKILVKTTSSTNRCVSKTVLGGIILINIFLSRFLNTYLC